MYNYKPVLATLLTTLIAVVVSYGLKYQQWLSVKNTDWLSDVRTAQPNKKNLAIYNNSKQAHTHAVIKHYVSTVVDALAHYKTACTQLTQHTRTHVRIAYFGDSMIEGDIITEYLRTYLQQTYGGSGVGFVPLSAPTAGYTNSYQLSFTTNYLAYNFNVRDTVNNYKPYLSGYVFDVAPNTTATSKLALYNTYAKCNFYLLGYNYNSTTQVVETTVNNKLVQLTLQPFSAFKTLIKSSTTSAAVTVAPYSKLAYYGLQTEADTGIVLDNYAFRGSTGMNLSVLNYNLLHQINVARPYDLVIVQYGLNIGTNEQQDFSAYQKTMQRVLRYLKKCMPQASFILVSVGDKCYKQNKQWVSAPYIPYLIKTQQALADSSAAYFFNLNTTMGGVGGMLTWANADTALAQKDYTHITSAGGKKVAQELFNLIK